MNVGITVFAQMLEHLPCYEFNKYINKYKGNHRIRKFPCYDQFLCLAFAQFTYRESLRDIATCLNSHHEKLYHIGFRGQVSKSTLADANEVRDYRIYQDFAYHLISIARNLYNDEELAVGIELRPLCFRLNNHRSVPVPFSLDAFPENQGCHQDAHLPRSAGLHTDIYKPDSRQATSKSWILSHWKKIP